MVQGPAGALGLWVVGCNVWDSKGGSKMPIDPQSRENHHPQILKNRPKGSDFAYWGFWGLGLKIWVQGVRASGFGLRVHGFGMFSFGDSALGFGSEASGLAFEL